LRGPADRPRRARVLGSIAQIVALGAGVWFLVRTAARSWGTVAIADLRPAWMPIILGSLLTSATYVYIVFVWARSLRWWSQRPPFLRAARIWFVSNLARFIPGMVWQLAGLATLARANDISAAAATGGSLLQQVVLLLTGLIVTAVWAPTVLVRWASPWSLGALAVCGVALLVGGLPAALPWGGRLLGRVLRRPIAWPTPSRRSITVYVVSLCLPWVAYGVSFWLFGVGLLGAGAPGFTLAVGGFVASYVAGIIVVFAPSGLVVREAALVAALGPAIGGGPALVLALASRLWLLVVELATAVSVLALHAVAEPHGARAP
jgi:glycosyltransferase 2 family protein